MCYVRSIPPGTEKSEVTPLYKANSFFFVIETEFTARYEMFKIIQVKFSLQTPRTVKDRHFVERL